MLDVDRPLSPPTSGPLGRAALAGTTVGVQAGALTGTALVAVLGTLAGAIAGAASGALLGLVNGVALRVVDLAPSQRWRARITTAITSTLLGGAAVMIGYANSSGMSAWVPLVAITGFMLIGLLLGPVAAFGAQPIRLRPGGRLWRPEQLLGRTLAAAVLIGATAGAVAGLILGLLTYLPTAAFALVEGAMGCGLAGLVIVFALALPVMCLKLRARR